MVNSTYLLFTGEKPYWINVYQCVSMSLCSMYVSLIHSHNALYTTWAFIYIVDSNSDVSSHDCAMCILTLFVLIWFKYLPLRHNGPFKNGTLRVVRFSFQNTSCDFIDMKLILTLESNGCYFSLHQLSNSMIKAIHKFYHVCVCLV